MTDAAVAPLPDAQALAYVEVWAKNMGHVLGQIGGSAFSMECSEEGPPEAAPPHTSDMQVIAAASGGLRGELGLRLPQPVCTAAAQLFLGEAQDPQAEFKTDYREAVEELLRQVAGHTATALKPGWGEVQMRMEFGAAPSWSVASRGWMNSVAGAPCRVWLEWQTSPALMAALRASNTASGPAVAPGASPEPASPAAASPAKMGLLMDVQLAVTLRFGGRRMLLREILELSSGSVVELDRQVQEPADLLLDGRLIARGEVVVVDGNYGLRVLELVAPSASSPGAANRAE